MCFKRQSYGCTAVWHPGMHAVCTQLSATQANIALHAVVPVSVAVPYPKSCNCFCSVLSGGDCLLFLELKLHALSLWLLFSTSICMSVATLNVAPEALQVLNCKLRSQATTLLDVSSRMSNSECSGSLTEKKDTHLLTIEYRAFLIPHGLLW